MSKSRYNHKKNKRKNIKQETEKKDNNSFISKSKLFIKRMYFFLFKDDSWQSFIAFLIFSYILIKFIIMPLLSLIFGNSMPIVAVVSGSMEHKIAKLPNTNQYYICNHTFDKSFKINFDEYWKLCGNYYERLGINKSKFKKFPFHNGFNTGDVMIIFGVNPDTIKQGQIIVFRRTFKPEPIIHRAIVIYKNNNKTIYITTKGDHNPYSGLIDTKIQPNEIIGKAVLRIPYLGMPKVWLNKLFSLFVGGA